MTELPVWQSPWATLSPIYFLGANFGFTVIRYLALGVIPYLWLYRKTTAPSPHLINRKLPSDRQILEEMVHSLKSLFIFLVGAFYVYWGSKQGWVTLYQNVSDHGWRYYLLTILAMLLIQDTYFYWLHRLFHTRPFFRWTHRRHHASVNTTPLTAYSFDTAEALMHSLIAPLAYSWFPIHPSTLLVFQLLMAFQNLNAHSGHEWVPRRLRESFPLKYWVSSTIHHEHHLKSHSHFGLYFTFWDKWMKTDGASFSKVRMS